MSVTPTAHAASHASGGNDPILTLTLTGPITLTEQSAPGSPADNTAYLFLRANGANQELCVKFDDDSVVVIADSVP
jgi:hypothetical protein